MLDTWEITQLYRDLAIQACLNQDVAALKRYQSYGVDFNLIYVYGDSLLHVAIAYDRPLSVEALLDLGADIEIVSFMDGTTPLNFAALTNKQYYVEYFLDKGADINTRDFAGFTPLLNALATDADTQNLITYLLKQPDIDVNIPEDSGVTPLIAAYILDAPCFGQILNHPNFDVTYNRLLLEGGELTELEMILEAIPGIDMEMIESYHQAKLFGFQYDFDGCFTFKGLTPHQYNCFEFEAYTNPKGISNFAQSYDVFYNEVIVNSDLPVYASFSFNMVHDALNFSAKLPSSTEYYWKIRAGELTFIPSGWDQHTIAFVIHGDKLYRCNRGVESDGIHGVEEFRITKPQGLTEDVIQKMLLAEGEPGFFQEDIISLLGLEKMGTIENPAQIVGNCTWDSLEAALEASFVSSFMSQGINSEDAHKMAKESFLLWEQYDLNQKLIDVIDNKEALVQYEIYDDLLIKALEHHHNPDDINDVLRGVVILEELSEPTVYQTFDQEIGQQVYAYDHGSYKYISYMETYQPSYYEYFKSFVVPNGLTPQEQQEAKEYYDFLKTCDAYQQHVPGESIVAADVLNLGYNDSLALIFNDTATPAASPLMVQGILQPLLPIQESHFVHHEQSVWA